jgi:polyisoprenoid-binding protein YceI
MKPHPFQLGRRTALLLVCLLLAACSGTPATNQSAEAPAATPVVAVQQQPAPTATEGAPTAEPTPEAAGAAPVAAERQIFRIDQSQSEARFILDELLFGSPNRVVGRTGEVSGEIEIDLADPIQTRVGAIEINARDLATDNRFRNRSVNRMILQANRDEYQFIIFTPTAIEGLPAVANVGDTLALQITGDLLIRDVVQPVTFAVTVTAVSATELHGLAQTIVQRADFDLTIPSVEGVADVSEEVQLELEFVALAGE